MNTHKTINLKNGTRAVLVPVDGTAAVTVMAFYEVGSRYEPSELAGVSHFLEHLVFKGTKRRPSTMHLARELDSVGAEYNAYTDRDNTAFYVRLQSDRLDLAVDMLEDMVYHSLFRTEDIRSEAGVIVEELRMYDDNPLMAVEETMQEELFRGSALGRKIGGTPKSVMGMDRKRMLDFRDRFYRPERTVVAIAGNFDERSALRLVEAGFGRKRPPRTADRPFRRHRFPHGSRPVFRVVRKETEQVQVAIGFPGYPSEHRHSVALRVMANILGGTMSSRLFLTVRERYGLAYHIQAAAHGFQDVGQMAIQAGLSKDGVHRGLDLIMSECRRIARRPVTAEELNRAQENIKGRMTLGLEDSRSMAGWYGRQELLQRRSITPERRIREVMAVTREDVQRVAKDIFRPDRMAVSVIGPFDGQEDFVRHARKL
ncbi:insulinase family protein [Candidatus Uhrbacteria bacterium]|nr:insulinase family protein [Candidatus Uhrbacteria bacterium]